MSACGVSVTLPLTVSPARKTGDGTTISMSVVPSPVVRCSGASVTSRSSVPITTAKTPSVSMSRPPRSIVSRADHRASASEDPGAQDGTVNDEDPPVNSLVPIGSSIFVTPTQSSVAFSLPASVPTWSIISHESFIAPAAASARPAQRYR